MCPDPSFTLAIIGGGASGCLVAAQLLRRARAPRRILLIERMTDLGRGVAYGTACREHLLNVPAGRMGAFPEEIDGFLRWVETHAGEPGFPAAVDAGDFLPRTLYGDYLRHVLAEARLGAAPGVEFEAVKGEVVDIEDESGALRIRCGDGRAFAAGRVVLAIGHLAGEYPIRKPLPVYHSQRYVHVPWRPGALAGIPPDAAVLIVGAGLTAVDLIVELHAAGHRGLIHALSRRGLQPQVHRPDPPYPHYIDTSRPPATVRELVRRVRAEVRSAAARGIDWRPVLDALRPQSAALWRAWSWTERARFLRHMRPFWEIHRHRLAPPVAATVEARRAEGRLQFYAGRLTKLVEVTDGAEAQFRTRRTGRLLNVRVDRVINCTGPRTDYSKYQHPLLINLLARGLIDHDPLALGVQADPDGSVLRYHAGPSGWLYTLGAPLKGGLWECTAIPEIRDQAAALAETLLRSVGEPAVQPVPAPV
jgi:uncharacterized NAD(P)/FAD-binding protein YdhS